MDWYEEEVEQLIKTRDGLSYQPQTVFLWQLFHQDVGEFI